MTHSSKVLIKTLHPPLTKRETKAVEKAALRYLAHQQREKGGTHWPYEMAGDVLDRLETSDKRWTSLAAIVAAKAKEMDAAGKKAPKPPKTNPMSERYDAPKYTEEDAEGMKAMRRCGYTCKAIAEEYGCSPITVSRLTQGWDEPQERERAA